jgi:hypothetical protein
MHKTANKMAMGEMSKMPPTYSDLFGEANKSGDNSLRDWFGKSKSSDGTPGWVQLGGKFAGKPCAKQPGQTTKPKCGSSKMKRNLNKGEEEAAFRRKNAEDPNPDRKGKAKNVKTEENMLERADMWHPDPEKDKKLGGPGANARAREDRAASKPKEDPKKLRKGESYMDWGKRQKANKMKKEELELDERTRYAKETGKDPQTGKPSEKGGTIKPGSAMSKVRKSLAGQGLMSSRRKAIQPQGKKKEKGKKGYQGQTPVDRIKGNLARKRAPKPDIGSRFD